MKTAPALAAFLAVLAVWVIAVAAPPPAPEPAVPPPPAKYDVTVRYAIDAPRNDRVPQFREMLAFFKKQGFTRNEENAPEDEPDNSRYVEMSGSIAADNARNLLVERHVRALRLIPVKAMLPAADAAVRVQLELPGAMLLVPGRYLYTTSAVRRVESEGGAALQQQRLLAGQVRTVLANLGFSEGVGYDDRAHTRLLGSISPARLDDLLNDLRRQPAAWKLKAQPPIDSVLLAGLRGYRGGEDVLDGILNVWDAYFERQRREFEAAAKDDKSIYPKENDLIGKLVAAWAQHRAGAAYLKTLPRVELESETITRGLLLANLVRHPDSTGVLQALWGNVLASPSAPDLLALLLRRLPESVTADLPLLLRTDSPVRVTEVQPGLPLPLAWKEPAPPAPELEKLTPEVRDLVAAADKDTARHLELILWLSPDDGNRSWRHELADAAPGIVVQGRVGPLVSVWLAPAQAPALAALPTVSTIRLPRSGQPRVLGAPAEKLDTAEALRASGLARLHEAKLKGKGIRLAVIDGDFRGWQPLAGKTLPPRTRLFDLTAERNVNLLPDPSPAGEAVGHGTAIALAAALAAPEVDLLLIRIDPAAPYQLLTLARALNGEPLRSLNLAQRGDDLDEMQAELERRRAALLLRRAAQMQKAPDVNQKKVLLKKKEKGALTADEEDLLKDIEEFETYKKDQAQLDADQHEFDERSKRYLRLNEELRGLSGVRVVATGLSWQEGQPVDGGGTLSRYFDDEPFKKALWFQAAGDTRGQTWAGLFRDRDGDGIMEFQPPGARLPPQRWSPSLAFLSWQPATGAASADIPQGARLRLTIQWREPHDPDFLRHGEDAYRAPLAPLRLMLLHQLDPTGAKQPADDFQVVAESVGLPERLDNQPGSAVYEQTLDVPVAQAGRYALRIEGALPAGIRPLDRPTVPAAEKTWELRPRLFVATLAGPGRALLADFATEEGAIGAPGDARQPITVGAADAAGKSLPASAYGPALGMELLPKPAVLSPAVGEGPAPTTSLSAGFAAGLAASALSAGAPTDKFLRTLGIRPGELLRVPEDWRGRGR